MASANIIIDRKLVIERTPLRSSVTKVINNLTDELAKETKNLEVIDELMNQLRDKYHRLEEVQGHIKTWMLDQEDITDEGYQQDFEKAEEYRDKYVAMSRKVEKFISCSEAAVAAASLNGSNSNDCSQNYCDCKSKYKLPVLELKKFNGEVSDWLNWWSHYQAVHTDEKLTPEIKFQYLMQSMKPGSRAANLVNSFPPTSENYPKAIEQLTERFGREDLLVEYYVRELQNMVIDKASLQRNSESLGLFYDRLETQLRALESLGMGKDKTAYFLKPLVENCLPEDALRLWQRKREETDLGADGSEELEQLMTFIRSEVNNEDRILLVRGKSKAKDEQKTSQKKGANKTSNSQKNTPTTATLTTTAETSKEKPTKMCIFCEKDHAASECFRARKMTLDAKNEFLKGKKACTSCFRIGHLAKVCRSWVRCMICDQRHYTLMCPKTEKPTDDKEEPPGATGGTEKKADNVTHSFSATDTITAGSEILLQTIIVKLVAGDKQIKVRALLDSGSQRSYISQDAVKRLKLSPKGRETVIHSMLGGVQTAPCSESIYALTIGKINGTYKRDIQARGQEKICGRIPTCSGECLGKKTYKELNICNDPDVSNVIELLIGAEYYGELQTGNVKYLPTGLTALETYLGWTITGIHKKQKQTKCTELIHNSLHSMTMSVENLWKLDILGIEEPLEKQSTKENHQKIMKHFNNSIKKLENGRYEVDLPWKDDCQPLSDNKFLAKKRLERVKSTLISQGIMIDYMAVFQTWLDDDIIEVVPSNEVNNFGHYLPHRPVIKESSATTKIRPVFDASASKRGEPSLNNCLEKGPNLIELIPDVLDWFRLKKVGVSADIEKAFLQIQITKEHRDFLRFFCPMDDRIFRHRRVVFGVTASPFLLAAVINYHLDRVPEEQQETATRLRNSFYVDNCITSLDNEDQLQVFMSESRSVMQSAKMNLRSWQTNVELAESNEEKRQEIEVLGLKWNLKEDALRCNLSNISKDSPDKITKRFILSTAQKIYDPIGFTSPFALQPKLIMQKLWEIKIGWDDELDENWTKPFDKWRKTLSDVGQIKIPRLLIRSPEISLHVFVDASKDAYAVCIFLRSKHRDGSKASLELVRGKSRVSPKKRMTIPRLELMACCIGARLLESFTAATKMQNETVTYWSDSTTALWWVQHPGPWTLFVDNRVREIRKLSSPEQWRHVPGEQNPADLPSRGCDGKQLLQSRWWEGPAWLKESEETWLSTTMNTPDKNVTEEQKCTSMLTCEASEELENLFKNISSYQLIVKVVAWIKRFCNNASPTFDKRQGSLQTKEIQGAEFLLFRQVQREMSLKSVNLHPDTLFIDEHGLLRVKSKVVARQDTENFRFPVVLFGGHYITGRLIENCHKTHQHAGTNLLSGVLRERFFILGGRRAVRKVVNSCGQCRRYRAKPFIAKPVHLPEDRVAEAAVFEITGIDYFGHVFLRDGSKAWICLFTCAIYRAIHFELVSSLSTEVFLLALRRFISRRGRPRVYSDNGSNFVGANNVLQKVDWEKVQGYAAINCIQWNFIPPTASWWGGWWERLVGVTKNLLKRTLGKSSLDYEEMQTILCDCEITINSRPLTYLSENSHDLVPLTPAMFLSDTKGAAVEDINVVDRASLNRRLRYKQRLSQELRTRFRSAYLGQLFNVGKKQATREIQEGEVVLIENPKEKKVNWCLGKVVHLFPGKDSVVRRVLVKTSDGMLERPIQRLYPLEVSSSDKIVEKVKEVATERNAGVNVESAKFAFGCQAHRK